MSLELTCHVDTGRHGMQQNGGNGHMVEFSMRPGQTLKISDYRRDSPGYRFLWQGYQIRNFDYPHSVHEVTRTLKHSYSPTLERTQ